MTTPDQHTQATDPAEEGGTRNAPTGSSSRQTESPAESTDSANEEPLFGQGLLSGLRSRWDDVQASFVDDLSAATENCPVTAM